MLIMFNDSYKNFEQLFLDAKLKGDADEVFRITHSLKGLAGTIGASDLFKATQLLETACINQGENIDEIFKDVVSKLQTVIAGLDGLVEQQEDIFFQRKN
jgi:HPt (histidine-containing phosphotransfer) domain-containing protein